MRNNSLYFTFQPFRILYLSWLIDYKESYAWYIGLGTISDCFVWVIARLGAVFNFNFTILYCMLKWPISNYLMIREHLRRYLREFWTMISTFDFFFSFIMY